MATVLIVEDERLLGKALAGSLSDDGHQTHLASSAEEAAEWMAERHIDLALVDCRLPGMHGIVFLEQFVAVHPDAAAIMMTAQADVQTAIKAMRLGAVDFLIKPLDLGAVSLVVNRCLRVRRLHQTWRHEIKTKSQAFGLHQVIGDSPDVEKAKSLVRRLGALTVANGATPPNVLITGETGTGKDLIARAIHYEGSRRDGQFVQVNCAALPDGLVESELFGHVKGSFTDAQSSKRGLFEVADGGTLFLDEVSSLPLAMQAKVLTAIGTGRIRPVGGAEESIVSVHLVAAMNEDPQELIAAGRFREDLYHRLRVMHIELPPLRQRGDDLMTLANHFTRVYSRKFGMTVRTISPAAKSALRSYDWPGNVRELSHAIEGAVLLSGDELDPQFLPKRRTSTRLTESLDGDECIRLDFSRGPIALEGVERTLITRAMREARDNVTRAAELLGLSRDTLRYRLDKFGLEHRRNGSSTQGVGS